MKKPTRTPGPTDAEIIEQIKRFPIKNLDDAAHRRCFEYAMAVLSAKGDISKVPMPTQWGTVQ